MLRKSLFFVLLGVVQGLSLIPLWVWYRMSEFAYLLVYRLFGYRKTVVETNLRTSFPELEEKEIQQLVRRFYLHFCDVIVETLKSFSLSDRQLQRRVKLRNPEIADQMIQEDKGSILLASHYGNFEWMCARLDLMCQDRIPTFAVYNPFSSELFESLLTWMRERRGLKMVPMRYAMVKAVKQLQEFCLFGFIVDQSPHRGNRLYFTSLLGKTTPFHTSVSKIALRTQAPVYYADVRKVARGHYEVEAGSSANRSLSP